MQEDNEKEKQAAAFTQNDISEPPVETSMLEYLSK